MSKLLFSTDTNSSKNLSRLYNQGKLRRIYRGIYTDNLASPIEVVVKSNWMQIVAYLVPQGILTFRTALELKPIPFQKGQSIVFVTSTYWKTITLPGLILKVIKGNYDSYYEPVSLELSRSNTARMLLENLKPVKKNEFKGIKTIADNGVENYLAQELKLHKDKTLKQLRDDAQVISQSLGLQYEYKKLTKIISDLLSDNSDESELFKPSYAKGLVNKKLYDVNRILLFDKLSLYIKRCTFIERFFQFTKESYRNISFYESYFSNFSTKFDIKETEDIIFSGNEINNRHADSHDVLSYFSLTNDYSEMSKCPKNPAELIDILKSRHAYLTRERPDLNPGEFKKERNSISTHFVEPKDIVGTLTQGFEIYQLVAPGMPRALFMQFFICEVNPFAGGNGALAHIMMNAELVNENQVKIMIPTVLQDNYLTGIRRASREQYFQTYCKVMDQAQAYAHSFDWSDYTLAKGKIEADDADKPDEGLPVFSRALRALELSIVPV